MLYLAIYAEINLIGSAILVLILFKYRESNDRQAASLAYSRVVVATLAVLLLDTVWAFTEGRTGPVFLYLNYFINAAYLFMTGLIGFLWLQFVLYRLHKGLPSLWVRVLMFVPLAALFALCALAPWKHWLFEVTADNVYHRGPLLIIQQIICYGYLFAAGGYSLLRGLRENNLEKRSEAFTLTSFFVLPTLGSFLTLFHYGLPALWPLAALSLLLVYLNLQSRQISTDELTGLNNRRQFDRYLLAQMEDPRREKRLYLLLLDIDAFKKINDTYGHLAGDAALVQTARLLKQVCGVWNCFLARYGGDEFAIVFTAYEATRAEQLRCDLTEAFDRFNASGAAPYSLTISIGTGAHSPDMASPADLIAQADRSLYEAKAARQTRAL